MTWPFGPAHTEGASGGGSTTTIIQSTDRTSQTIPASGSVQVLSFNNDAAFVTVTADFVGLFSDAVAGQTLDVWVVQDSTGNHSVSFPGVTRWMGTTPPAVPQSAQTLYQIVFDGTTYVGRYSPAVPQAPDAPGFLTLTPAATSIIASCNPARIAGSDAAGDQITKYRFKITPHAGGGTTTQDVTLPAALTTTFSGLSATTSYDVSVQAFTPTTGLSTATMLTISTSGSATVPSAPAIIGTTTPSSGATVTLSPSLTDGGSSIDKYTVRAQGPGAAAPTPLQTPAKRLSSSGLAVSLVSGDSGYANVTLGSKLLVFAGDNSWTGTRTLKVNGVLVAGGVTKAADNSDAYVTHWWVDVDATLAGTMPTLLFELSGTPAPVAGSLELIVLEVPSMAGFDQGGGTAPKAFGKTHFPAGVTGTLGQPDEVLYAAWMFSDDSIGTPAYVLNDGTPSNDPTDVSFTNTSSPFTTAKAGTRLVVASFHNTSGTTATGVALKATFGHNGIGILVAYKTAASGAYDQTVTVNTPASPITATFTGMVDGTPYTITGHAHNGSGVNVGEGAGYSLPSTTTIQRGTTVGPGGNSALAQARGMMGGVTQTTWSQMLDRWTAVAPTGTMSEQYAFFGIAGLSTWGSGDAVGIRQFYDNAGAAPTGSIFVDLADWAIPGQGRPGYTLAQVGAGNAAATFHIPSGASAGLGIADQLGKIPRTKWLRLAYECDQNWPAWAAEGHIADFTAAWNTVTAEILLYDANAKFVLNLSALWGGGIAGVSPGVADGQHSHALWDLIIAGLNNVDAVGFDCYGDVPNRAPYGTTNAGRISFYTAELAMIRAWAISVGKKICIPEWGVSSKTQYDGQKSPNFAIDGVTFVQMMHDWMVGLPATGAGSLIYQVPFDAYDPNNPGSSDFRGMRLVPGQDAAAPLYKSLFNAA